jgi:hypothetical protein
MLRATAEGQRHALKAEHDQSYQIIQHAAAAAASSVLPLPYICRAWLPLTAIMVLCQIMSHTSMQGLVCAIASSSGAYVAAAVLGHLHRHRCRHLKHIPCMIVNIVA